jgi:hypothetical protein
MLIRGHVAGMFAAIAVAFNAALFAPLCAFLFGFVLVVGAHHPEWLARSDASLCVSVSSLRDRIFTGKRRAPIPRAKVPWICDSAGFTEISTYGRWRWSAKEHADFVVRASDDIGKMAWASPQDWMCEPWVVNGGSFYERGRRIRFPGTGLKVKDHQRRTVDNLLELRALAPTIRWTPVLQGWSLGEYLDCLEMYDLAGLDLRKEPVVGIGSVCRRQGTLGASLIISHLAEVERLKIHGFGFKVSGLEVSWDNMVSADSMAWSLEARYSAPLPGHTHQRCNNCLENALLWREDVLVRLTEARARGPMPITADDRD